jgi:hypothetical protein
MDWGAFSVSEPKGVSQMGMTINRPYRDALYDSLMTDLYLFVAWIVRTRATSHDISRTRPFNSRLAQRQTRPDRTVVPLRFAAQRLDQLYFFSVRFFVP